MYSGFRKPHAWCLKMVMQEIRPSNLKHNCNCKHIVNWPLCVANLHSCADQERWYDWTPPYSPCFLQGCSLRHAAHGRQILCAQRSGSQEYASNKTCLVSIAIFVVVCVCTVQMLSLIHSNRACFFFPSDSAISDQQISKVYNFLADAWSMLTIAYFS